MKNLISILLFGTLFLTGSISQAPEDPFGWTEPIVIPGSIYVLWGGGAHPDSVYPSMSVYFSENNSNNIEDLREDSLNVPVGGTKKMNLAVADFDKNGSDEIIGAWEGPNSSVTLHLLNPDNKLKIPVEGNLIQGSGEQKRIFIVPGDYDGDQMDEFILAFIDEDKTINIRLYDSDGTFTPKLKASVNNEDLSGNPLNKTRFSVISGDYDNNGDDEIALLGYDADNDTQFEKGLYVRIYDVNGNTIEPKVKNTIIPETTITNSQFSVNEIVLAASTIQGNEQQDIIAIAFTTIHNEGPNTDDTYLQLLKTGLDLNSLIFDENKKESDYHNPNFLPSISLASGDFDDDGSEELIFARSGFFDMYHTDADLNLNRQPGGGFTTVSDGDDLDESYDYLEICNVDDMPGEEMIVVKNVYNNDFENPFPQGFFFSVFGNTSDTSFNFGLKSSAANKTEIPNDWPVRTYALAAGDFEGSKVTIQAPRYFHQSGISQPIVILNAPPVHFDVFNGEIYDINTCFSNEPCDFISSYTKEISQTFALTTEIKSSWDVSAGFANEGSVSAGIEAEAAPLGVGVSVSTEYSQNFEYHLLGEYGENFDSTSTSGQTQTIQINAYAVEDDQIFATITDYDIWEYPYYIGSSTNEAGVIVAFRPTKSEARWFPSKSVSGYSYRPIHEVGNILSYYSYDSVNSNPNIFQEIQPKNDISTPTFVLSANSKFGWELTENNFNNSNAFKGVRFGVDAGALAFGYKFNYNQSNSYLYTHSTNISEELKLSVDVGGINRSIGPTEYRITPYAYWSGQGALVIDYSVEPEIDLGGGSTWWQEMYGNNPDPTMILPWRLDLEKGFPDPDASKYQQTRDIRLKPSFLSPGDTAIITANIRNFSLVNTPSDVKVRFYLGDPASGGELVSDIFGKNEFSTDGVVPSRGLKTVSFVWVRPLVSSHSRMYMVIDPDNTINEVHENNNVGWISIQNSPQTSFTEKIEVITGNMKLFQNYPNPFSEISRIDYFLGQNDFISLQVFDISGKLMETYEQGFRKPGTYSIEIDGANFESGMYYYTLKGKVSGSESGKMIVIH